MYIKAAVDLYNSLMRGSYAEVTVLAKNPPHWSFGYFYDKINDSIRYSITRGVECAYTSIAKSELVSKLSFNNENELKN